MNNVPFGSADRHFVSTAVAPVVVGEVERVPMAAQYLHLALRSKWLILGCIAAAVSIGILLTLLATPQYTATTRLEISREGSQIVNVRDVEPETKSIDTEFYQTQYGLLQSRALALHVARDLHLVDNAKFFTTFGHKKLVDGAKPGGALISDRAERERVAIDILLKHLSVDPIRLSRLVDVSWTGPDAAMSAQIANTWASAFIQSNLQRRFDATAYARRFLEERLEQLRQKLEESERKLVGYASNEAIINIPAGTGPEGKTQERSLTADTLASLNQALSEATAQRIQAQSKIRSGAGGAAAEALANPAINTLRQRRAEAAAEYSRLMTQFEPGYPAAESLAAQIRQLDQSIAREESRVQGSLSNEYRDSLKREEDLRQRVDSLKAAFLDQRRRSIQYNIFQRDVDTNRELYDGLLQRYKEIGVAGGVGSNNVAIVDAAAVPERPSSPRPVLNLLLSLIVGLIAGIGLALIREQIDEALNDPNDLPERLGTPLLGAIPNTNGAEPREELLDPKSGLTEAYLSVQTSLAFSSEHGIPNTLAVTSARASEGKSTTAYAIANVLSRGGSKAVLVDGDMRSPSVHENAGLSNKVGLSNYLSGTEDIAGLLQRVDGQSLAYMCAGPVPPNAAELLRGPRLAMLLGELRARFDYIVMDAPPVLGLADAPIIASHVEGTLFVVQAGNIKARVAQRALDRLRQARAHIVGSVLTKFDSRRAASAYGYEYGYGYGSGTVYGKHKPASGGQ